MAIEYKRGRCQMCGYNRCIDTMEFHHINSSGKDFSISEKGYTRSLAKVQEEFDKCKLLCANCHRELHAQAQLPRETAVETAGELLEARPYLPAGRKPRVISSRVLSEVRKDRAKERFRDYAPAA